MVHVSITHNMLNECNLETQVCLTIMFGIEMLLCDNCEIGEYTRDVSSQWLSKHTPTARN
jgi:hypothetical protein